MKLLGTIRIFMSSDGSGVSIHHLPSGGLYTYEASALPLLKYLQSQATLPNCVQSLPELGLDDTQYTECVAFLKKNHLLV